MTSTDSVRVGRRDPRRGDYSGPDGARIVLRDRAASSRASSRWRAVASCGAASVTGRAAIGHERGGRPSRASTVSSTCTAWPTSSWWSTRRCAEGRLILNADDPLLLERGRKLPVPVTWFTLDAGHPDVGDHLARGGQACMLDGEALVFRRGSELRTLARVDDPDRVPRRRAPQPRRTRSAPSGSRRAGLSRQGHPKGAVQFRQRRGEESRSRQRVAAERRHGSLSTLPTMPIRSLQSRRLWQPFLPSGALCF